MHLQSSARPGNAAVLPNLPGTVFHIAARLDSARATCATPIVAPYIIVACMWRMLWSELSRYIREPRVGLWMFHARAMA